MEVLMTEMVGQDVSLRVCVEDGYFIIERTGKDEYRCVAFHVNVNKGIPEEIEDSRSIQDVIDHITSVLDKSPDVIDTALMMEVLTDFDEIKETYEENKDGIIRYTGGYVKEPTEDMDIYDVLDVVSSMVSLGCLQTIDKFL